MLTYLRRVNKIELKNEGNVANGAGTEQKGIFSTVISLYFERARERVVARCLTVAIIFISWQE